LTRKAVFVGGTPPRNGRVKGGYRGDPEISNVSLTLFKERCPDARRCQFSGSRFVGEKLRLRICVKDFYKGASVQVIRMPMTEKYRGKALELAGLNKAFDEANFPGSKRMRESASSRSTQE
jgi:hypothetical protein